MLMTARTPARNHPRHSVDIWLLLAVIILAVLCLILAMPLAGASGNDRGFSPARVGVSGTSEAAFEAPPASPRVAESVPGPLASCGQFGDPFVASMSPTSVAPGGTFQIAWCNPAWVYLDGAYEVTYFRIYIGTSPSGTFQAIGDPLGPTYGAVNIVTGASDAGQTYYFFVRSFGREFSLGTWTNKNKDTNVVSVQVTGGGGGGGGNTGTCGQFGEPFNSALSPSTVNAGQDTQFTWCNPSWVYLDGAYEVNYYVVYSSLTQSGGYTAISGQIGAQYNGTVISTSAADAGKTYYLFVRSFGREFSLGTWTNKNKDSSISTLRINATGGGGGGGGGSATCTPDNTTLCLYNGRFKIQTDYKDYANNRGSAKAVAFTTDTGYFWIVNDKNVEIVAKIVSFCGGGSNNYGFYGGGLTDLEVTIKVTDTKNNIYREYKNDLGQPFTLKRDGPFPCP